MNEDRLRGEGSQAQDIKGARLRGEGIQAHRVRGSRLLE